MLTSQVISIFPNALQWNPSGKTGNVSLNLQNLVHFRAPFFKNHVYFTLHDRPSLSKSYHLAWPLFLGFIVFG